MIMMLHSISGVSSGNCSALCDQMEILDNKAERLLCMQKKRGLYLKDLEVDQVEVTRM